MMRVKRTMMRWRVDGVGVCSQVGIEMRGADLRPFLDQDFARWILLMQKRAKLWNVERWQYRIAQRVFAGNGWHASLRYCSSLS